ncbi:hypothetical protein DPMN_180753, partial [Dreissena polymorpha]
MMRSAAAKRCAEVICSPKLAAGLFEPKNEHLVLALQNAATKVNMHQLLRPSRIIRAKAREAGVDHEVSDIQTNAPVVNMEYLEGDNSFETNKK